MNNPTVKALAAHLKWALDYIADGQEVPSHWCEFGYAPDRGACEFHEKYFGAREAIESFYPQDIEATDE